MTGRAPVDVIPSSVVKMLRFIVFSCFVVLSLCQINNDKNVEGGSLKVPEDGSGVHRNVDSTESICTGENEVHTDCKKSCPPNTCLSIVAKFKCDSTEPCKKGCLCKPGYLRQHPDSPCIPICQCTEMKHSPDCGVQDSTTKE